MKKARFDNSYTGLITGFILPLISFYLIYRLMLPGGPFGEFITKADKADALSKFLSLAILPNLLLFFIFLWGKWDRAARGVLAATIIIAIVVVIIKFTI